MDCAVATPGSHLQGGQGGHHQGGQDRTHTGPDVTRDRPIPGGDQSRDVEAGYAGRGRDGVERGRGEGMERGREGVESGYSTQSREKDRKEDIVVPYMDSDSQVWHPQELSLLFS